jgi:hypothetical protein
MYHIGIIGPLNRYLDGMIKGSRVSLHSLWTFSDFNVITTHLGRGNQGIGHVGNMEGLVYNKKDYLSITGVIISKTS